MGMNFQQEMSESFFFKRKNRGKNNEKTKKRTNEIRFIENQKKNEKIKNVIWI